MNSQLKRVTLALLAGLIVTLLTGLIVTAEKPVGPSCEMCMDISMGYTERGWPITYFETTEHLDGTQENDWLPGSFMIDVALWGLVCLTVLTAITRKRRKS